MINIPLISKITKGLPILAPENIEDMFPIPLDYIKHDNELFMLRVSGQSMVNMGVRDKDLAIIEISETAINGDIVAALIDDSTTIKRFFKEKDYIRLKSENDAMEPIVVDDCRILGKLVGIFRSFK